MTILKNVIFTRKYEKRDGSEGKEYITVGHVHSGQYGDYLTLYKHINLAAFESKPGDNRATFNLYDPKPREGAQPVRDTRGRQPAADAPDELNDDIPF